MTAQPATNVSSASAVNITFSQEELLYLLTLLGYTNFPGLAPTLIENVTEAEYAAMMRSAEHSLRARNVIRFNQATIVVEKIIAGLLRACTIAPIRIRAIRVLFDGKVDAALFHFSPKYAIEQRNLDAVYEFTLFDERETMYKSLFALINGGTAVPESQGQDNYEYTVSQVAVVTTALIRGDQAIDESKALTMLAEAGLDEDTARWLNRVLRQEFVASTSITIQEPLTDQAAVDADTEVFELAQTQRELVVFVKDNSDGTANYRCTPTDFDGVQSHLRSRVEAVLGALPQN